MDVKRVLGALAAAIALSACGGDDGGSGTIGGPGDGDWNPGVFLPSATFKNQCAKPRTGTNPQGQPFPDTQGSFVTENNWLRSWTNELYFWYDEVVDRNPANYSNTANYFTLMKTFQASPSGAAKDRFHFTARTEEFEAFANSGLTFGYGATFLIVSSVPPREVVVVTVEPNTSAAAAGVRRGDRIVTIDGVDLVNGGNTRVLNAGLFPEDNGESHTFELRSGDVTRTVTLVSDTFAATPVHTVEVIPTDSGPVGYILFNEHIATAEAGLVDAIDTLAAANVQDLVLDLRYNGGGYTEIASQLAYMIAGSARTAGQAFMTTVWNDKHSTTNPVTGEALAPIPFIDRTAGFSLPEGAPLPTLNLSRVFVLTSSETCSASESIMNGLRGVDVEVIQIGTTTCGKPYGYYAFDNCGTTYFTVQYQGVNAKSFGGFTDGFSPADTPADELGEPLPGCTTLDDVDHQLGDPAETMLATALTYRASGQCPAPATASSTGQAKTSRGRGVTGEIRRPPYREISRMRLPERKKL